jgi:hypothetical protein
MGTSDSEMTLPAAEIVHDMQGRMRFRIPSRKRDEGYFASLEQHFGSCDMVEAVEVQPLTGSLLLVHHGSAHDLVEYAQAHNLFTLKESVHMQKPVSSTLQKAFQHADDWLQNRTEGSYDVKEVALVGLLAVAGIQMLRGQFLGPASNFVWYVAGLVAGRSNH